MTESIRCPWAEKSAIERDYHDREWGTPQHDERVLFEFLLLEGAQAGLSWRTILARREGYRAVFDGFDAQRMAAYTDADLARRLQDPRIIRNRLKVQAARSNARCYLELCAERGGLAPYLWGWVDGRPLCNQWQQAAQVPARTPLSDAISADLRRRGFRFVGSTIIYAYLQAVGVVNDHLLDCFRHADCGRPVG
jgi:DNA-3-methyladenine glycosylase I